LPFSSAESSLRDILQSVALITDFLGEMDFAGYQSDAKTRSAVERQMQILSEAAFRLGDKAEKLCPGPDWKGLRGMGNILRHQYHRVDDEIVWDTIKEELPQLSTAVLKALGSESRS
jgi:uncharacterized protein with HEPN domain